jgi:hypothetical protein
MASEAKPSIFSKPAPMTSSQEKRASALYLPTLLRLANRRQYIIIKNKRVEVERPRYDVLTL